MRGPWPMLSTAIFQRFDYVGPFFTDLSDESYCGHGSELIYPHAVNMKDHVPAWKHGGDTYPIRHELVQRCFQAIATADLVFAWIDTPDCYGTLFELGYAKALGKRVAVGFAGGDFYQGRLDREYDPDVQPDPLDELWFTYFACHGQVYEDGPEDALKQVIAELGWDVFPDTFDSPLEAMFAEEWRNQSLHLLYPLVSQHAVKNGAYRLDFAFPRLELGIELDGYTYHSNREAFNNDRRRQREIEALGWRIVRFSGDELRNDIAACVREAARFLDIQKQRKDR